MIRFYRVIMVCFACVPLVSGSLSNQELPDVWVLMNDGSISLTAELEEAGGTLPVVFVRATDCWPCVESFLEHEIPEGWKRRRIVVYSYVLDSELDKARQRLNGMKVLLDTNYACLTKMRIHHTPVVYWLEMGSDGKIQTRANFESIDRK